MSAPATAFPAREIGLVALFALAVYMLLAIASYSSNDPAWTFAGSDLAVSNLVGQSGALTADIMLLAFGWPAYLFPAALIAFGLLVLGRHEVAPRTWPLALVRVGGFIAVLVAACVLMRLHVTVGELPAGPGGALGHSLVAVGLPALNWVGLTLCALVMLATGSQAMFGFSWLAVVESIGRGVHAFAHLVVVAALGLGRNLARAWTASGRLREHSIKGDVGLTRPRTVEPTLPPLVSAALPAEATPPADAAPATKAAPPTEAASSTEPAPPTGALLPTEATLLTEAPPPIVANRAATIAAERRVVQSPPAAATAPRTTIDPRPKVHAEEGSHAEGSSHVELPALDLLEDYSDSGGGYSSESLDEMSNLLESKLADFRVKAEVVSVQPGPVVTRFELQPAAGVKVSKFTSLAKDLARSLAVVSVRIVEIIPGKSVVGIEIPNEQRETVRLKEILDSPEYRKAETPLTLALGKDIAGTAVMADIGKMPHLLVAGTTGSGKSVGINAMLLSMLYKATPDELRLILVDPKMLELAVYDGIPHLLTPVVTDMKDAALALNWCVVEMERRYKLMAAMGVRNLAGYNRKVADAVASGEPLNDPLWPDDAGEPPPALTRLPFIVVVIDEFADMMMIVGKKVEQVIARIAQKARAAGIHLVLATQRPSVDVITGLIKANIPARISFQVSSKIDSRTILDQAGAEQLLGHGDMLFLPPGTSMPVRVHGAFVSDDEVHNVAQDWRNRGAPDYIGDLLAATPDADVPGTVDFGDTESSEPRYDEAVAFVLETRKASISGVQRKLRIGYNRAARLIEAMEEAGVVSPMDASGTREVLAPAPPRD